jgi:hypothetical protein
MSKADKKACAPGRHAIGEVSGADRGCRRSECEAIKRRLADADAFWTNGQFDRMLRAKRRTWGAELSHENQMLQEQLDKMTQLVNHQVKFEAQRASLPAQMKALKEKVTVMTVEARELSEALEASTVEAADWKRRYLKEWEAYKLQSSKKKRQ